MTTNNIRQNRIFELYKGGATQYELSKTFSCTRQYISWVLHKYFREEYETIKEERRKAIADSKLYKATCEWCDEEFTYKKVGGVERTYCSMPCVWKGAAQKAKYYTRKEGETDREYNNNRRKAKYLLNEVYRESIKELNRQLYKKNKHKSDARAKLNYAVKKGLIIRPDACSKCGKKAPDEVKRIEAHHEDYSKPLDIVWLCGPCHFVIDGRGKKLHRK